MEMHSCIYKSICKSYWYETVLRHLFVRIGYRQKSRYAKIGCYFYQRKKGTIFSQMLSRWKSHHYKRSCTSVSCCCCCCYQISERRHRMHIHGILLTTRMILGKPSDVREKNQIKRKKEKGSGQRKKTEMKKKQARRKNSLGDNRKKSRKERRNRWRRKERIKERSREREEVELEALKVASVTGFVHKPTGGGGWFEECPRNPDNPRTPSFRLCNCIQSVGPYVPCYFWMTNMAVLRVTRPEHGRRCA